MAGIGREAGSIETSQALMPRSQLATQEPAGAKDRLCPGCGNRGTLPYRRWVKVQHIHFCDLGCFRRWLAKRISPPPPHAEVPDRQPSEDVVPLFESVVGFDYDERQMEWDRVLSVLRLPLCYQVAVRDVLGQARWRTAKSPQGYVRNASYRQALSQQLPFLADQVTDPNGEVKKFRVVSSSAPYSKDPGYGEDDAGNKITQEEHHSWLNQKHHVNSDSYDPFLTWSLEILAERQKAWELGRDGNLYSRHHYDQTPPVPQKVKPAVLYANSWRAAMETDDYDSTDWIQDVPNWLRKDHVGPRERIPRPTFAGWEHSHDDIDESNFVNWERVAEIAVSKPYMRKPIAKALHLRLDELVGLDEAVRRERNPARKKAIAAAYKWLDRNFDRIRAVTRSSSEVAARAALYGPPPRPLTNQQKCLRASDAFDQIFRRQVVSDARNDGPREMLYRVKYGG